MRAHTVGYARVSTSEQNIELQLQSLKDFGCDRIFVDQQTGTTMQRKEWNECQNYLREGDRLVVWKLDRLGRRAGALITLIEQLQEKKIEFISLKDNLNATSSMGKAMMQMICVFAEMERNVISERTKAGLAAAKARGGLKIGRSKKLTDEDKSMIKSMMSKNISVKAIASRFGVDPTTIWRNVGSKASCQQDQIDQALQR